MANEYRLTAQRIEVLGNGDLTVPVRVSNVVFNVLNGGVPAARVTGDSIEVLRTADTNPPKIVTGLTIEALNNGAPLARVSAAFLESVSGGSPAAWATGATVEILRTADVNPPRVVTGNNLEILHPGEAFARATSLAVEVLIFIGAVPNTVRGRFFNVY